MRKYGQNFWRQVPFIRLLIPFVAGILLERYIPVAIHLMMIVSAISMLFLLIVYFLSSQKKYPLRWLNGISFNLLLICFGITLMYCKDYVHDAKWIGNDYKPNTPVLVVLQEPLTKKTNSYKALAQVKAVWQNNQWVTVKGNLLLYFKKDSLPSLQYGSQLVIRKSLQPITNSGNPGGFDYIQYCASQGIYYQAFLQPKDYQITPEQQVNTFTKWLYAMRDHVLSVLRKYIPGEKELGVAEALLIGYRNDLDKELVRSYSNTGVVHIIAISGLHLGMIYGLLLWILKPFRRKKWIRWARPVIILAVLWGFSLLAGAAASILRSAVMFTFIVIGESLGRKTQVYNTLAASAFCMLVYDPYFLWDVGFQLSYAAVLSIMLFMQPVYRQVYCSNKLLKAVWQLNAITLSAQVLTLPIILLYFHQFPNLFLFTNFIAVPLSGFILYGELLLLVCSIVPGLNLLIGKTCSFLITQMNGVIERTDWLPFSVTDNIQVGLIQVWLLYCSIACIAYWLLQKKPRYAMISILVMTVCCLLNSIDTISRQKKHQLVVYNIPKHKAIDIMEGERLQYIGDRVVETDHSMKNFHLRPSRILYGVTNGPLRKTGFSGHFMFTGKHLVLFADSSLSIPSGKQKIRVDLIVISGNPRLYLSRLAAAFDCPQYVFDASNPLWKIRYWKKDADSLHLRHHSVPEQGAFVMAL